MLTVVSARDAPHMTSLTSLTFGGGHLFGVLRVPGSAVCTTELQLLYTPGQVTTDRLSKHSWKNLVCLRPPPVAIARLHPMLHPSPSVAALARGRVRGTAAAQRRAHEPLCGCAAIGPTLPHLPATCAVFFSELLYIVIRWYLYPYLTRNARSKFTLY